MHTHGVMIDTMLIRTPTFWLIIKSILTSYAYNTYPGNINKPIKYLTSPSPNN